MSIENILGKVKHKLTLSLSDADHDLELKLLWAKDRPPIYSREQFARFWDVRYVEPRTGTDTEQK